MYKTILVLLVVAFLAAACGSPSPTPDTTVRLAPVSALSPRLRQLSPEIQQAYRFALANRDVLEKILLAYPPAAKGWLPPRVFTAHSYGHLTQVALHQDSALGEEERFALVSALVEAVLLLSPDEPVVEAQARIPFPTEP